LAFLVAFNVLTVIYVSVRLGKMSDGQSGDHSASRRLVNRPWMKHRIKLAEYCLKCQYCGAWEFCRVSL